MSPQSTSRTDGLAAEQSPPVKDLAELLLTSLSGLAAAGEVETACRLAGKACVTLRHCDQATARRFDVLLHRLTPKLTW